MYKLNEGGFLVLLIFWYNIGSIWLFNSFG